MGDCPFFLQRKDLPAPVHFKDQHNTFDYEILQKHVAEPTSPASGYSYLFADNIDGKYKIKKSDGSVISIEDIITQADTKVRIKEGGTLIGTSAINFATASDFDIVYNGIDDETTISIADNAIGNNEIATHTNSKITIANASQLPTVAPSDAEYIVKSANGVLSAERVLVAGNNITLDYSVAGQLTITSTLSNGGPYDFTSSVKFSGIISPTSLSADANNWNPSGLSTANRIRVSGTAARNITGILATNNDNLWFSLHNVGSYNITLKDESSSSTDINRFALYGDIILHPDESVILWYDSVTNRWRCDSNASSGSTLTQGYLAKNTTDLTWSNDAILHTVLTYTFSANEMGTDKTYEVLVQGICRTDTAYAPELQTKITFGTTVMFDQQTYALTDSGTQYFAYEARLIFTNKGLTNSQWIGGDIGLSYQRSSGVAGYGEIYGDEQNGFSKVGGIASEDTTTSKTFKIELGFDDADALHIFTRKFSYIKELL
jgi:hypothetical protein